LANYRHQYYQLSEYLYFEDQKQNPIQIRAIARRELPNLLHAVYGALESGEDWAVEFSSNVNLFLDYFGLNRDRQALTARAEKMAERPDSSGWYLARSNRGEQLLDASHYQEAQAVFQEILDQLGETASCNRCLILGLLGRCLKHQGQPDQAAAYYRQGLAVAKALESSPDIKRHTGTLQTDLADVLTAMGDYNGARAAYEASLYIN
jgi:tetratricopeptide (TPR) repeat protein